MTSRSQLEYPALKKTIYVYQFIAHETMEKKIYIRQVSKQAHDL